MNRTPYHIGEAGSVPKSAYQHGEKQVHILANLAFAVAAKRNIHIVAKPKRERNVPAAPKFGDVERAEWVVEVHAEVKSHNGTQTNRHIAIAREVGIELHGEANPRHEQFKAAVALERFGTAENNR